MPKEVIYSSDGAYMLATDGNEYPEVGIPEGTVGQYRQRGVHVGWTRKRHVEVGVASFDVSREMPSDGVFLALDRDGINRLIRSLRKARDAAYGSDA